MLSPGVILIRIGVLYSSVAVERSGGVLESREAVFQNGFPHGFMEIS
jgi:hypothetical protein